MIISHFLAVQRQPTPTLHTYVQKIPRKKLSCQTSAQVVTETT